MKVKENVVYIEILSVNSSLTCKEENS